MFKFNIHSVVVVYSIGKALQRLIYYPFSVVLPKTKNSVLSKFNFALVISACIICTDQSISVIFLKLFLLNLYLPHKLFFLFFMVPSNPKKEK